MKNLSSLLFGLLFLMASTAQAQNLARLSASPSQRSSIAATSHVGARVACENGFAAGFACNNVDLLSHLTPEDLGGVELSDIWGWTDSQTGKEYAIVGRTDGTAFVDISDPENPIYLGELINGGSVAKVWRDMKVYNDHVFVVADNIPGHGMQVFKLNQLRSVANPPVTFSPTYTYREFEEGHNIFINEDTAVAYAVGTETCGGGLHMIDISTPTAPTFLGCFAHEGTGRLGTGYTHDVQCIVYDGPDTEHLGKEICFSLNETVVSIADVTDKTNVTVVSSASYPNVAYAHQGWLTEDRRYLFTDDELDESGFGNQTRTLVWDVSDLDDPILVHEYVAETASIDHNQYVVGNYLYQANYTSGLRILDIANPEDPIEVGYFDTHPASDGRGFGGAWSNYPFFESGVIIVSSDVDGLFVLRSTLSASVAREAETLPHVRSLSAAYPNPFVGSTQVDLDLETPQVVSVAVYDVQGKLVRQLHSGLLAAHQSHRFVLQAEDLPAGAYFIYVKGETFSQTQQVTLVK